MCSINYHFQLVQLLKRFNETLILSTEQVVKSFEFLFEARKYVPFQGQAELHDILSYLKDNMAINNLKTLNDLLDHYAAGDEELNEFLDELTSPTLSNMWIAQPHSPCVQMIYSGADNQIKPISAQCANQQPLALLPYVFKAISLCHSDQAGRALLKDSRELEIDGSGKEQGCLC